MEPNTVFENIHEILTRLNIVNKDSEQLDLDTTFNDVSGMDSLDRVEVVMNLEEEYDICILDNELTQVNTLGDLVKLVEKKLDEKKEVH